MKHKVQPLVDIVDSAENFYLYFDLPGVNESDLDVGVEGHVLSVQAKQLTGDPDKPETYREKNYESHYELGETIDVEKIKAKLDQGVLKLDLPKIAKKGPSKIKIDVA